jgi:hypothetical protein
MDAVADAKRLLHVDEFDDRVAQAERLRRDLGLLEPEDWAQARVGTNRS